MKQTIVNKLQEIEKEHKIRMLFACESGSRGWQFPSPDSDYDVRFIYVRQHNYYLSVLNREYDLNFPISNELDIYGWDILKVLQLLIRSNVTPFEWLQSPIVYREEAGFKDSLWRLCSDFFSQRSNIHHYLGIATGAMESIENDDEIKIKKLFYVLRPLLAAKWCLEKNGIAPMSIGPLLELPGEEVRKQILDLIKQKENAAEAQLIRIDPVLKSFIETEFERISDASKEIPRNNFDAAKLDEFFLSIIRQYDY